MMGQKEQDLIEERLVKLSQEKGIFPCNETGKCPYEYGDPPPERNMEGMPLISGDARSCPIYGHICPEFMEDFGLTAEGLQARANEHCAGIREMLGLKDDTPSH